jgi:quercetin dioxygenase-like cupin family protein
MATKGQTLVNTRSRQTIEFLTTANDSNGRLLEMVAAWQPHSPEPAEHYHPFQKEYFKVYEGELTVKQNGEITVYRESEMFEINKGVVHAVWNASGKTVKVYWKVKPALKTENMLEMRATLSQKRTLLTNIFSRLLLKMKYRKELRIGKISF